MSDTNVPAGLSIWHTQFHISKAEQRTVDPGLVRIAVRCFYILWGEGKRDFERSEQ